MFFCTVLQMAQKTNVNVGTAGDGAKIGYNVMEINQNVQNMYVNRAPPPHVYPAYVYPAPNLQESRELQEKELQERSVYFLLFFA